MIFIRKCIHVTNNNNNNSLVYMEMLSSDINCKFLVVTTNRTSAFGYLLPLRKAVLEEEHRRFISILVSN